jgi:hypothetical protein
VARSFRLHGPKWVSPAPHWPVWHADMTWETEHFRGRFVESGDTAGSPRETGKAHPFMTGPAGGELLVIAWCALPGSGVHKAYWEDVDGILQATYRMSGAEDRCMSFPITAGYEHQFMVQFAERHALRVVGEWRDHGASRPVLLTRAQIAEELAPIQDREEAPSDTEVA